VSLGFEQEKSVEVVSNRQRSPDGGKKQHHCWYSRAINRRISTIVHKFFSILTGLSTESAGKFLSGYAAS
jgi:hypothetical protein